MSTLPSEGFEGGGRGDTTGNLLGVSGLGSDLPTEKQFRHSPSHLPLTKRAEALRLAAETLPD